MCYFAFVTLINIFIHDDDDVYVQYIQYKYSIIIISSFYQVLLGNRSIYIYIETCFSIKHIYIRTLRI